MMIVLRMTMMPTIMIIKNKGSTDGNDSNDSELLEIGQVELGTKVRALQR